MDLQRINIQNAELTGGKFIDTDFRDANFKQVKINFPVLSTAVINFDVLKSIEYGKSHFEGHKKIISCMKFSSDGKLLVTGSDDFTLRLWEIKSGHCLTIFQGHEDFIFSIDISKDPIEIVSGGKEGIIKLWDLMTGDCIKDYKQDSTKKASPISYVCLIQNNTIVASNFDKEILIWSKDGILFNSFTYIATFVSLFPFNLPKANNNFRFFAGTCNGDLAMYKTKSKKPKFIEKNYHIGAVSSISISDNAKTFVTVGIDDYIRVWKTIKPATRFFSQTMHTKVREVKTNSNGLFFVKLFSNSRMIATRGLHSIKIYNLKTLNLI